MFTKKSAAKKILSDTKHFFSSEQEYVIVDGETYTRLDLGFYRASMRRLEALGFRFVADIENATLKNGPFDPKTFIRVGLNGSGTIVSGLYHIKPAWWARLMLWLGGTRLKPIVEFETEFGDGTFIVTSTATMAENFDPPPQIDVLYVHHVEIEGLLEIHRRRVLEHSRPEMREPLVFHGLQGLLDSQHRLDELKSRHRESLGWISKTEFDRFNQGLPSSNNEVYDEIVRLREGESGKDHPRNPAETHQYRNWVE